MLRIQLLFCCIAFASASRLIRRELESADTADNVCINWFGNNLNWDDIPFESMDPWGFTPEGCTEAIVEPYGEYSCATYDYSADAVQRIQPCNGDCFDGVCVNGYSTAQPSFICSAGQAQNGTDCWPCVPGNYNANVGGVCSPCPEGTYASDFESVTCTPCEAGFIAPYAATQYCEACPEGYTTDGYGQTECVPDAAVPTSEPSSEPEEACVACSQEVPSCEAGCEDCIIISQTCASCATATCNDEATAEPTLEQTTEPAVSCEVCLAEFKAVGGCDAMLADEDVTSLIPDGCDSCGSTAFVYCINEFANPYIAPSSTQTTESPSKPPTRLPSAYPSFSPALSPTAGEQIIQSPSRSPTGLPSAYPSFAPANNPTAGSPFATPISVPTKAPTLDEQDNLNVMYSNTKLTCHNKDQKISQPCNGGRGTGCSYDLCAQHCVLESECNFFFHIDRTLGCILYSSCDETRTAAYSGSTVEIMRD